MGPSTVTLHSHYAAVRCSTDGGATWTESLPHGIDVYMQVGARLGFVAAGGYCATCDATCEAVFFFTTDDGDSVRRDLLRLRPADRLVDRPPEKKGGRKRKAVAVGEESAGEEAPRRLLVTLWKRIVVELERRATTEDGFHDDYVLDNLIRCPDDPKNGTVSHVFDALRDTIRKRTAFRHLYFRCFRRSFAPGRRQAVRAVQEFEAEW